MLETACRRAGRHRGLDWAVRLQGWSVKRATSDVASWVDDRHGGRGEGGPLEAQPEVPGLNADSLRVIKNSLS